MRRPRLGRILILLVVIAATTISVGGGTTFIALKATTTPQFCTTCHLMQPYYDSWETSSHSHVTCVDCHFEPGMLETIEGKMQAVVMLTKYLTNTEGTKPWAEVSDYSCMRSGCHSTRLLQGELDYGRVRFDHRHHLVGFPKGKTLRCTSCHSQIVQGDHVSVTPTACFLCHFSGEPPLTASGERHIDDCNLCHGPPPDEIRLGEFSFRHSEYLERGVRCDSCHGDVTRGKGEVLRLRCRSCHNVVEHLERFDETAFIHRHHVTDHAVSCTECHTEIEHGLPPREEHYQRDCSDCHQGTHGAPSQVYRGLGGTGVEDNPSVMYSARVTCTGCHRPLFAGARVPVAGATYEADPLACIDCHGVGFEGMAEAWQAEYRQSFGGVSEAVGELEEMLVEEWEEGDPAKARRHLTAAAENLSLVALDKSKGVHNLPYVRSLLQRAYDDAAEGRLALDPDTRADPAPIGPFVASKQGCTLLCHVGVEAEPVREAFGFPFPHGTHLKKAKLDCAQCHLPEPHGTTHIQPVSCMLCHHKQEDEPDACAACHTDVTTLRSGELGDPDSGSMLDLDCLACHAGISEGHHLDGVKANCNDCHEDDADDFAAEFYDEWVAECEAPLVELEKLLDKAPAELAATAREEIAALRKARPFHNAAYVAERAADWRRRLAPQ